MPDRCRNCHSEIDPRRTMGLCPACLVDGLFSRGEEEERDGVWAGPFRIVEQVGEGAFGNVFRAEQTQPVSRTVALKVMKPSVSNRQTLARFEAERQALASLDHPNIATFYDAGETDDEGLPFFAMEFVDGVPLDRFASEKRLGTRERVQLIARTAEAIHQAHQKGIIHRDLKPSNVLVAPAEDAGEPVIKVIDFGIARATEQVLTDATLLTRGDEMLGTPDYLSPEQAASGGDDVDVRSDVYALAAMLYELLAGAPPLDLAGRGVALVRALDEIRGTQPAPVDETARKRGHAPVPRDLALIVAKALVKDRRERYGGAGELADDLRRFLAGEAVSAQPPSMIYRIGKLVRRHKLASGAVVLAALALIAGTVVSAVMASRAERAAETTSVAYAQSDFQRATDLMLSRDHDHAVAFLCRGLRENPEDRIALRQLMLLLTMVDFPQPVGEFLVGNGKNVSIAISEDGSTGVVEEAGTKVTFFGIREPEKPLRSAMLPSNVWKLVTIPRSGAFAAATERHGIRFLAYSDGSPVSEPFPTSRIPDRIVPASDGRCLALASGREVRLADWRRREIRWKINTTSAVRDVAVSPDGRFVGCIDEAGTFRLIDAEIGEDAMPERSFVNAGVSLRFTPDGTRCLVGVRGGRAGAGGAVHMFDLPGIEREPLPETVLPIGGEPQTIDFLCGGSHALVVPVHDYNAYLWDLKLGRLASRTPASHRSVFGTGVALPDASRVYTADRRGVVRQWDGYKTLPTGAPFRIGRFCDSIRATPDSRHLVVQDVNGHVQIWDTRRRTMPVRYFARKGKVSVAKLDQAGKRLATLSSDGWFRVWDVATAEPIREKPTGHAEAVGDVSWEAGVCAIGLPDGTVLSFRIDGDRLEACGEWKVGGRAWLIRVSSEGRILVGTDTGEAGLFAPGGKGLPARELDRRRLQGWIGAAVWGPDEMLVAGSVRGDALLWRDGEFVGALETAPVLDPDASPKFQGFAFSPDGRHVAALRIDGSVPVWDTGSRKLLPMDWRHASRAHQVHKHRQRLVFGDDDLLFTTSCYDNRTRAWDLASGGPAWEGLVQRYTERMVAMNPATNEVVGFGYLWIRDAKSGRLLIAAADLSFHDGDASNGIHFSRDGRRFAVPGSYGAARVFSLPPPPERPAERWFLDLAENWVGVRVGADGNVRIIPIAERLLARKAALPDESAPVQRELAKWLRTPVEERGVAPGDSQVTQDALDRLARQPNPTSGRTALWHRPGDPQALLTLAESFHRAYPYPAVKPMARFYAKEACRLGSGELREKAEEFMNKMASGK